MLWPWQRRSSKLSILPWQDDPHAAIVGPEKMLGEIDSLNFLKTMLATAIIAFLLVNILLSVVVMNRMNTFAFVADGSRFGCRVIPLELQ